MTSAPGSRIGPQRGDQPVRTVRHRDDRPRPDPRLRGPPRDARYTARGSAGPRQGSLGRPRRTPRCRARPGRGTGSAARRSRSSGLALGASRVAGRRPAAEDTASATARIRPTARPPGPQPGRRAWSARHAAGPARPRPGVDDRGSSAASSAATASRSVAGASIVMDARYERPRIGHRLGHDRRARGQRQQKAKTDEVARDPVDVDDDARPPKEARALDAPDAVDDPESAATRSAQPVERRGSTRVRRPATRAAAAGRPVDPPRAASAARRGARDSRTARPTPSGRTRQGSRRGRDS